MEISFKDQTALITGATRGIGRSTALLMAKSGASLIVTGTRKSSLDGLKDFFKQHEIPGEHVFLEVDFGDEISTGAFLQQLQSLPRIDVCINNAGINIIKDAKDATDQDYKLLMDINLAAPFKISRVVAEKMKAQSYGRIVNIASIWGVITKAKRSLYTTSKHALIGMTKTFAIEYAPYGVLVNVVSPGFTLTELTKKSLSLQEMDEISSQIPVKRMAETDDIAMVILFMASKLNKYITAQNIIADGGFSVV